MIFLLAMEHLHKLFKYAQDTGVIGFLHHNCANFCMSLYADDAALFIKPTIQDLQASKFLLKLFGEASGLVTNLEKTEFYLLGCQDINLTDLLGPDQQISHFPCHYLGLPLHFKALPKAAIQPMVHKVANCLPGWKRNLFSYLARELLVKSVLSALTTYFMTVYKLPKWACNDIDHFRRSFLWRGEDPDKVCGGHCLVKWKVCTIPKKWGGLCIKDIDKF
jgi:hypothetical protein